MSKPLDIAPACTDCGTTEPGSRLNGRCYDCAEREARACHGEGETRMEAAARRAKDGKR